MKINGDKTLKIVRLLACLLVLTLAQQTPAAPRQQVKRHIQLNKLISSLKLGKREGKTAARYIELLKGAQLDFSMTPEVESRIRRAGAYLGKKGLDDLVAALRDNGSTPAPQPTPGPITSPPLSFHHCVSQSFPDTPAGRMTIMEEGAKVTDLVNNPGQSIGKGFVIQFTEGGEFIGAVKFAYYREGPDGMLYKVSDVRDAQCHKIENFSNWDTKEVKGPLHKWETLQMPINGRHYYLSLGYSKNEEVDRIEALFKNTHPQQ